MFLPTDDVNCKYNHENALENPNKFHWNLLREDEIRHYNILENNLKTKPGAAESIRTQLLRKLMHVGKVFLEHTCVIGILVRQLVQLKEKIITTVLQVHQTLECERECIVNNALHLILFKCYYQHKK